MNGLRQNLAQARFTLIFGTVSAFGGALVVYLFSLDGLPAWVSGSIGIAWVIVLFSLILLHTEGEEAKVGREEERTAVRKLQEKLNVEQRDEAINLTTRVISSSARSLRVITAELREFSRVREGAGLLTTGSQDYAFLRKRMLRQICDDIRSVFEGDTRGVNTTTWPYNFFKVALFEPEPTPLNAKKLHQNAEPSFNNKAGR